MPSRESDKAPDPKPVLSGLSLEDLETLLPDLPSFRIKQIFKWSARGVSSFDEMTDLGRDLRNELTGRFLLRDSEVETKLEDPDETIKLRVALGDGAMIEAVLLADGEGRKPACLSTQAGCPAGCVFCKTGALGFLRNLAASEIIEQFYHLRALCPGIANIVIMGMGEPFLNPGALRKSLEILTDPEGMGLSRRRITVSTSGVIAGIRNMADRGPAVRLAVSLTTADEALRRRLMPIAAANPLPTLKETLRYYQQKRGLRVTLEAVLLGGVNTREEDSAALAAFARGLDVVVNLIPWNPVEGLAFEGKPLREPGPGELARFGRALEARGLTVTRRFRKGRAVAGACGQLGTLL
jgi:23S rRNA (adenine2503-C2)-methyltransferase